MLSYVVSRGVVGFILTLKSQVFSSVLYKCRSLVPVDKRMIDDDETEQLERFLVEGIGHVTKVSITDVLDCVFDVASRSDASLRILVRLDDQLVNREDVLCSEVVERVRSLCHRSKVLSVDVSKY